MPKRAAWIQLLGVVVFAVTTWMPCYHLRTYPGLERLPPGSYVMPEARVEVPAVELWGGLYALYAGHGTTALWAARRWYPLALVPFWVLALAWAGRVRAISYPVRRWVAGLVLLGLSLCVVAFEWVYLQADYVGFFGASLGAVERWLAWGVVLAVLFLRRPGAWRIQAVEATIAAQALLALVHGATLPLTDVRPWWEAHSLAALSEALWANYLPAFWIGFLGLLCAALPAYLWPQRLPLSAAKRESSPQ